VIFQCKKVILGGNSCQMLREKLVELHILCDAWGLELLS
jgi:hypothetical protein